MRISFPLLIVLCAVTLPIAASAAGLPPWQFGMTKEQVTSFKQFGPYAAFPNGDLQTFNGVFHGRKENVQFFFENNRLRRIGVYLWEGKDAKQGIPAWRRAYDVLQKDYGKVAQPDLIAKPGDPPVPPDITAIAGAANTYATGNTRLLPVKQPKDMRVAAVFMGMMVKGNSFVSGTVAMGNWFAIAIVFEPR